MKDAVRKFSHRIREAAKLRVEGWTWEKLAERYHYKNADSARAAITAHHPQEWQAAYEEARTRWLDEIEGEGGLTMRQLLRSQSEDIKLRAARAVLQHSSRCRIKRIAVTGNMAVTQGQAAKPLTPKEATDAIRAAYEAEQAAVEPQGQGDAPRPTQGPCAPDSGQGTGEGQANAVSAPA